jgi:cadmium resistance protein CadD (predicted permease)
VPEQQTYRGTHRHRAPLGWHPPRVQQGTNGDAGPPTDEPTAPFTPTFTGMQPVIADEAPSEPLTSAAEQSVTPEEDGHLKRWTFVAVLAAVWIVAAAVGLGLFYWWFHSINKTPCVFIVLVYLVMCTVAALIAAMVAHKPVVAGLAIALMSAPFASTAAAAVLYGVYFCEHASRCLVGVIPY